MDPKPKRINRNLTLANFNANGITNQTGELQKFLTEQEIDIMCISETHLKPTATLKLRNYTTYRTDRLNRHGGGTAITIKSQIPHRQAVLPKFNTLEATGIYIQLNNKETLVVAAYYPPQGQLDENDLDSLILTHKDFIICGDLNAKHRIWNSRTKTPRGEQLLDHSNKFNYAITGPRKPTSYPWSTTHNPDVLDICLTKNTSNIISHHGSGLGPHTSQTGFQHNTHQNQPNPGIKKRNRLERLHKTFTPNHPFRPQNQATIRYRHCSQNTHRHNNRNTRLHNHKPPHSLNRNPSGPQIHPKGKKRSKEKIATIQRPTSETSILPIPKGSKKKTTEHQNQQLGRQDRITRIQYQNSLEPNQKSPR